MLPEAEREGKRDVSSPLFSLSILSSLGLTSAACWPNPLGSGSLQSKRGNGPERKLAGDQHCGLHVLRSCIWSTSLFGCCFHKGEFYGSFSAICRWTRESLFFFFLRNTILKQIFSYICFHKWYDQRFNTGMCVFINILYFNSGPYFFPIQHVYIFTSFIFKIHVGLTEPTGNLICDKS